MHETTDTPPQSGPDRRSALQWVAVALGALATLALGIPIVGFLLGPLLGRKPDQWIDLGPITDFPLNDTRQVSFLNPDQQSLDGVTGGTTAYVRYQGTSKNKDGKLLHDFQIFAVFCAHLGCPVSWFPQSGLFMCPCHGGVYYSNGERASGPPPRGLYRYQHEVRKDHLWILAGHLPTLQNDLQKKA